MNEERFDDIEVREESLSHYGTPGMKWYVHNDETKRKYGELPGIGRAKKAAADSSESVKPSLAERGIEIIKKRRQEKKDKQAAARQAAIDQENEKKEKERLEAEYQRKYGMSKEKYDALREATLNSHDPRVVAKGILRRAGADELRGSSHERGIRLYEYHAEGAGGRAAPVSGRGL